MAEKSETKQPTHRAYSVIRREGQDDFWLNLGLVFPAQGRRAASTSCCRPSRSTARSSAARSPMTTKPAPRSLDA